MDETCNSRSPSGFNSIWRPTIKPTNTPLPRPCASSGRDYQNQLFTKTSIAHDGDAVYRTQTLNRKITKSSESFNSTPKPFRRQEALNLEVPYNTLRSLQTKSLGQENRPSQANNSMAQKLIHKQYNSPIDLYSMNNIRKTIEAHSELIAPGVKAINFKKLDGSVNKESEVYKLVKEEEERRRQQQQQSQSSDFNPSQQVQQEASGSSPIVSRQAIAHVKCGPQPQPIQYASEQVPLYVNDNQADERDASVYEKVCHEIKKLGHPVRQDAELDQQDKPKCRECGKFIVGPYAKLQNRFIHPHCFNCTTCGTSLKNSGYFVISDRLYCDIHAKQVANLMRVNYNFDANKQSNELTYTNQLKPQSSLSGHNNQLSTVSSSSKQQQQQTNKQNQDEHLQLQTSRPPAGVRFQSVDVASQSRPFYSTIRDGFTNRPESSTTNQATISTMFAKRDDHSNVDRRETRWTWKPAASCSAELGGADSNYYSNSFVASNSSTMRKVGTAPNNLADNNQRQTVEWKLQTTARNRQELADNCVSLQQPKQMARTPVCNHCRADIQGPYILAGETIWCKPCSQKHFVCCTCNRSLLNIGFVESGSQKYHCEHCFETYSTPNCSKCNMKVRGYCLNALGKQWHPDCFVCGHCRQPFGDSSFYLEDNVPYCQNDWNLLFTTKCHECSRPIGAGDKWIEALDQSYHADCFRCTNCRTKLEGTTFYCKGGRPFCRSHARTCL